MQFFAMTKFYMRRRGDDKLKSEKCGIIFICHLERSVAESKNLLVMCSLSAVCMTHPSPPLAKGDLGGIWM